MSMGDGTSQAPAGWYPDSKGDQRWWDGEAWTERTQSAETPPAAQHASPAAMTPTPSTPGGPFYTRKWFVGVAAAVVGLGIGAASAGTTDPKSSDEYKALSSRFEETKSDLSGTKSDLAESQKVAAQINEVADREAALTTREEDAAAAEKQVKVDAAAVLKREKAVGIAEDDIESNTISGDGMYEVGEDIKAGTYKTKGSSGCYYAVLNSTDNFDIATNGNIDGTGAATVRDGQYFSVSRCADWVRQ